MSNLVGQKQGDREQVAVCLSPRAAVTKYQKLSGLKKQNWRLEVQNEAVSRVTLSLVAPGDNPSLPLLASGVGLQSLACGCTTPFR